MSVLKSGLLTSLALASGLFVGGGLAPANASTVTWTFISAGNTLGNISSPHPELSTAGGYTITATAYNGIGGVTENLFAKTGGGDENGLGITSDPSGNHEIYGTHFIQLDVQSAIAVGLTGFNFSMGSTTGNEAWSVYGTNSAAGASLTLLAQGENDQLINHALADGYGYYDFFYDGSHRGTGGENVLLHEFGAVSAVPEVSTWAMMILGFCGIGAMTYRQRRRINIMRMAAA